MSQADIPDVHAAAASGLRYVDLNRRVNHDYGLLGLHFQSIVDPGSAPSHFPAVLVGFASDFRHHGAFHGLAYSSMLDPRTFTISVKGLVELLKEAPGTDCFARRSSVSLNASQHDGGRKPQDLYRSGRCGPRLSPFPRSQNGTTHAGRGIERVHTDAEEGLGEICVPVRAGASRRDAVARDVRASCFRLWRAIHALWLPPRSPTIT